MQRERISAEHINCRNFTFRMSASTRRERLRLFTKVNTGIFCSAGLLGLVAVLLLVGFRLVAVGVVVEQGDGCDFAPAHQPSRSDGCAELHDTGDAG